jgi:hypothetical protein
MKQKQSDASQKFDIAVGFCLEFYRSLMAAFLIMFVPQKCGDHTCGTLDNMLSGKSELYDAAGSINIVTFLTFLYLYYIEIRRENKMIDYLEINRELPKDNESVGEALVKLDSDKQDELHSLDHKYLHAGYAAMGMFAANTGLSAIPILQNGLDAKTYTVLLTNVLFIASKLHEVYSIVNTKENVFYSAYLTERQQFNDVDPDVLTPALAASEEDSLVSTAVSTKEVTIEETKEEV